MNTKRPSTDFRVGEKCRLSSSTRPLYLAGLEVEVVKINPQRVKVRTPEIPGHPRFSNQVVSCPTSLLRKLGEADPGQTTTVAFVVCPVCSERINLSERKDFESFSGREYAQHVEAQHPEACTGFGVPYAPTEFETVPAEQAPPKPRRKSWQQQEREDIAYLMEKHGYTHEVAQSIVRESRDEARAMRRMRGRV